jgi:hypothetical protein
VRKVGLKGLSLCLHLDGYCANLGACVLRQFQLVSAESTGQDVPAILLLVKQAVSGLTNTFDPNLLLHKVHVARVLHLEGQLALA